MTFLGTILHGNREQWQEFLSQRLQQTLPDLAEISKASGTTETVSGPNALLGLELAAELEGVVDGLRKLLWAYITALSARSGGQPEEVLEWHAPENTYTIEDPITTLWQ